MEERDGRNVDRGWARGPRRDRLQGSGVEIERATDSVAAPKMHCRQSCEVFQARPQRFVQRVHERGEWLSGAWFGRRVLRRMRPSRRLLMLSVLSVLALAATSGNVAHAQSDPATDWANYEKLTLASGLAGEPIDMAVLPDGRVLHTQRAGALRLTTPASGVTEVVNQFNVYTAGEQGLLTVALDPDFATNQWVYVYYSPRLDTPGGKPREPCRQARRRRTGTNGRATTSSPASSGPETRSTWRASSRSSRSIRIAAVARTTPVTSPGTPRGTCSSRSAITPVPAPATPKAMHRSTTVRE